MFDINKLGSTFGRLFGKTRNYRVLFDAYPDGIVLLDEHLQWVDANEQARRWFQWDREDSPPNLVDWFQPEEKKRIFAGLKALMHQGNPIESTETELYIPGHGTMQAKLDGTMTRWGKHKVLMLTIRNITDQKEREEKWRKLALHDPLTALPNRIYFEETVNELLNRQPSPFALFLLDLNDFKQINDHYGHWVGDQLLRYFGRKLTTCISREKGDFAARLAGDEFIILCRRPASMGQIRVLAEQLLRRISEPMLIENHRFVITSSIGISFYPDHGESWEELYKKADESMYQAKVQRDKAYVIFDTHSVNETHERVCNSL